MRDSRIESKESSRRKQEKACLPWKAFNNFLVLSFEPQGRETYLGAGRLRKNELPCSFSFQEGELCE